MTSQIKVGSFPYRPGFNPYQKLATEAIEAAGAEVTRIAPVKWFPVQHAFANTACNVLHFDWPHDWYAGKNVATRMLKRWMYTRGLQTKSTKKLVWTAHNLVAHDARDLQMEHQMLQRLITRCDGIVVLSEASEKALRDLYDVPLSTRVQKAPHGHYIDCYPNKISRTDARQRLKIGDAEQVFLSLGAVRPYKGHLEMIRDFGDIAQPGQRLIVAGKASDADFERQLRSVATEQSTKNPNCQIDFHCDSIPDDELQVFFNAADICVLPFTKVLNSGSLLMAMSFGIPVVAAEMGSIPEVVLVESSILFSPEKSGGLKIAMQEAAKRFAANAEFTPQKSELIQRVRNDYAWSHFGNATVELYRELLNDNG